MHVVMAALWNSHQYLKKPSMQVRVLGSRLSAAQKLDADAAAMQDEAAVMTDRLAAKRAELVTAAQQTARLHSVSAGTAGTANIWQSNACSHCYVSAVCLNSGKLLEMA